MITIKKTSTNEENVSARQIRFDLYQDDVHVATYTDICEAIEAKEALEAAQ